MKTATINRIRVKIEAAGAMNLLFHQSGDDRGLELAACLEREAHSLWRDSGHADIPTWEMQAAVTVRVKHKDHEKWSAEPTALSLRTAAATTELLEESIPTSHVGRAVCQK